MEAIYSIVTLCPCVSPNELDNGRLSYAKKEETTQTDVLCLPRPDITSISSSFSPSIKDFLPTYTNLKYIYGRVTRTKTYIYIWPCVFRGLIRSNFQKSCPAAATVAAIHSTRFLRDGASGFCLMIHPLPKPPGAVGRGGKGEEGGLGYTTAYLCVSTCMEHRGKKGKWIQKVHP
jgi:hypothetical protein